LKELALLLRLKPVYVMGHLHALWHDALEQQEDGDLSAWSDELIAESAQFDGDAPKFVFLLQDRGWLDGRLIHDWLDYAGRYLESKYRTSNPKRLSEIWSKHGLVWLESGSRRTKDAPPTLPDLTLPTAPNLTIPNITKQEKQRHRDFVWLKPEEHAKLKVALGKHLDAFLDRLNGYIGQIGEKKAAARYSSHYHVILNWFRSDIEKGLVRKYPSHLLRPRAPDPKEEDLPTPEDIEAAKKEAGLVR
jgi:hypothetical protein